MKKKMAVLLLVSLAAMALTACSKFECDLCGEEKTGVKRKAEVFGEEIEFCEDCYEEVKELQDAFKK